MSVALIPLGYLVVRTAQVGWAGIVDELLTVRVAELAVRSLGLALVVTSACILLGVCCAFAVTRTDLPSRRFFGVLAALPLAVPTYVAAFGWVSAFDNFEGFWPAALVLTLCCYPYVYLPVAGSLVGADPAQEEVSRSLGRGPVGTFLGVTVRQVRPAIMAGALLVALYVLSDFGAVSILRADTFTRAIFVEFDLGFDRTGALVLSTVLIALTVVLLVAESRTRQRQARYAPVNAATRRPHARARLGLLRWPTLAMLIAVSVSALGVPAVNLAQRLVAGVSRPGSLAEVASAAGNSLWISLTGAAITTLLALPIGILAARRRGKFPAFIERLSYLTHALPGVVIGLSLVFFGVTVAFALYQTVWLLLLAYAALFLPLAVAAVASAAGQSPPMLEDVARSLGRRSSTVWRTVTLPLAMPGIGAGAALVFITGMKELPATLFLRPTGMETLATRLWTHTTVGSYAAAAPYAALLVLVTVIPTWLLAVRLGILQRGGDT
ncbi:MAG TPA: iron ABC transporter permease [Propionibacteriaceae bacterium]|nr:iron ABC transporter permease [Propionibacteriaceae bacterium]